MRHSCRAMGWRSARAEQCKSATKIRGYVKPWIFFNVVTAIFSGFSRRREHLRHSRRIRKPGKLSPFSRDRRPKRPVLQFGEQKTAPFLYDFGREKRGVIFDRAENLSDIFQTVFDVVQNMSDKFQRVVAAVGTAGRIVTATRRTSGGGRQIFFGTNRASRKC